MMELSIILGMFALPAAALGILVIVIVGDIKSQREMKRFDSAVQKCIEVRGFGLTYRTLQRCKESNLPVKNRIEVLEYCINYQN